MRFRKTVFAKAADLLEDALEIAFLVTIRQHAVADAVVEGFEAALAFPRSHRTTQFIGLAWRETGHDLDQLHHLFLEDRHAQRAFEHGPDPRLAFASRALAGRLRIVDFLKPLPATQIRMHHAALDRPRPHDRDLHDQIVEHGRAQARQHRHLRTRFDLEHANRIGGADHRVGGFVILRQAGEIEAHARMPVDEIETLAQAGQHAEGETVDLEQLERFQIVLVPLDDRALGHRRVFHRHQGMQGMFGDDEAADMLGQVTRETAQLADQGDDALHDARIGIEASLAQGIGQRQIGIGVRIGHAQLVELILGQAKHAANVARRALAAVADDRCRQRRPRATVFVEHVLEHLLASLVLEIDVDVGRLLAFDREEALEQQVAVLGIDRRDAEAVADRRVRRRAAPLAEDRLRPCACPGDDVVDGQEEMLVTEFLDEDKLVFELASDLGRDAAWPKALRTLQGELAQMIDGTHAGRHQLVRIDIVDVAQVEPATCCNAPALRNQRGRVDRGEILASTQMALAIRKQCMAGFGDRAAEADGAQRILQGAPTACMHVHIAAGDQRQGMALAECLQLGQRRGIVDAVMQFDGNPGAPGKMMGNPGGIGIPVGDPGRTRRPQHQHLGVQAFDIGASQRVRALGTAPATARDQFADARISALAARQQDEFRAVVELHFGADDQGNAGCLGGFQRTHDAGQRTFVGDRQRAVAEPGRAFEQFRGTRCAALETEIAQRMQLGVGRWWIQANHPCSIQLPISPLAT